MKPVLSVIIPAYNCESYIRECLDSVLAQQRDDVEIVAVDDGSTDGTLAILNEYRFDKRIKVVEVPHKGASGARNTGMENAEGKYISFLDCDDKLQKGFLKEKSSWP
ncbi:MAG: glycosyltransferase [Saccharofermentans sp.]|nr:glycosyltransferase [Saccharofermentans sp.]